MKTYERTCIEDYSVEFQDGGYGVKVTLQRGKTYLTSGADEKGTVMVFTNYWINNVPQKIFANEKVFTE